ncbi:hypothetical protein THAOC_02800 [Thalassiosira oceanica]|uniref:Ketoreductase (KR) domain-containing protein n=1 Tax=Thalassiosira oceanica TaxID=159749 RepID=K0TDE5_THAOC|nr:hypothetical protein THAOC_02800 [Thalassiosira oceanica]|eukprot:EJK75475.1 hypothetical protein THAOC_02800 [Thalassiosira oceanica]
MQGANSGIGLALTKQLVRDHGCHVYLGSRNAQRGAAAVDQVKKSSGGGGSVELLQIDVSSDESVVKAARELSGRLGEGNHLDAIVNNAGTGFRLGLLFFFSRASTTRSKNRLTIILSLWFSSHNASPAEILDTNARGPGRVVDSFLPMLKKNGRIVNVGSGAGPMYFDILATREEKLKFTRPMSRDDVESEIRSIESSGDGFEAYAGSKALLACYTMHLAESHGPSGLTVSAITPGFIATSMTSGMGASKSPDEGTVSIKRCLFDDLPGNGYFYGSDGLRSPLQ